MKNIDVIVIGAGPAGLTAAIYASRAELNVMFIEKGAPGGKMVKTHKIENWSGDTMVTGPDLAKRMFSHAKEFKGIYKYGDVQEVKSHGEFEKEVILTSGESIKSKAVVIATGTVERIPEEIEGIHKFENRGVSYCAICDGPLYKGEETIIIGGGNSAVEEGTYLASVAKKVTVLVWGSEMIAEKKLQQELMKRKNVEVLFNAKSKKIVGTDKVDGLVVEVDGKERTINSKAIFPYIGLQPISEFAKNLKITNEQGYFEVNELMETNVKNIFAVGDVRVKPIRQIATAVSDGAIAGKILANVLG